MAWDCVPCMTLTDPPYVFNAKVHIKIAVHMTLLEQGINNAPF